MTTEELKKDWDKSIAAMNPKPVTALSDGHRIADAYAGNLPAKSQLANAIDEAISSRVGAERDRLKSVIESCEQTEIRT